MLVKNVEKYNIFHFTIKQNQTKTNNSELHPKDCNIKNSSIHQIFPTSYYTPKTLVFQNIHFIHVCTMVSTIWIIENMCLPPFATP